MIVLVDLLVVYLGVAVVLRKALIACVISEATVVVSETLIVFEFFVDEAVLVITPQIL